MTGLGFSKLNLGETIKSNQTVKPTAPSRSNLGGFAATPCRGFPARGVRPRGLSRPSRRFPICSILVRRMKTALRSTFMAMIFSTMLLSSGCEEKTAATDPTAQSTPGSTKPLEAADLVGYDGKKLRKSVDRIKECNEKNNQ